MTARTLGTAAAAGGALLALARPVWACGACAVGGGDSGAAPWIGLGVVAIVAYGVFFRGRR